MDVLILDCWYISASRLICSANTCMVYCWLFIMFRRKSLSLQLAGAGGIWEKFIGWGDHLLKLGVDDCSDCSGSGLLSASGVGKLAAIGVLIIMLDRFERLSERRKLVLGVIVISGGRLLDLASIDSICCEGCRGWLRG